VPLEQGWRHQPPVEQGRQPRPRAAVAELREDQRDVLVRGGDAPADAQRAVERLVDEPRHLGFVGQGEPRIEVRLERKLSEQREAERIDRAHADVPEPIAQFAPS
jgi:hypothetical protein